MADDKPGKAEGAFLTIGELATQLGIQQHILRYWETRFPQLRPLQRAGNRRYYRPADVALARRIDQLLNHQGYTVRGVQKLLDDGETGEAGVAPTEIVPDVVPEPAASGPDRAALRAIRDLLADALAEDKAHA